MKLVSPGITTGLAGTGGTDAPALEDAALLEEEALLEDEPPPCPQPAKPASASITPQIFQILQGGADLRASSSAIANAILRGQPDVPLLHPQNYKGDI